MKNKIFDKLKELINEKKQKQTTDNTKIIIYIFLVSIIFLLRIIFFTNRYGAIEHDSGWYLGVARNLAQRGIYASYTNTVINPEPGTHSSLHGRFSVQDEKGFIYFPAGVTAGPGYIIPQSLFLKILGYNWWQLRTFPLLCFFCLLILFSYFAYLLGGSMSLILIQFLLWVHPELYITFSYESFAEHVALLYFFLSIFFLSQVNKKQKLFSKYFLSGTFLALSILTKTIFMQVVLAFFVLFIYQVINNKKKKQVIKNWSTFLLGFLTPIILFETYRFTILFYKFGIEGFKAANQDFFLHFRNNGSGLKLEEIDWSYALRKLAVWKKIGFLNSLIPTFLILTSTSLLKKNKKQSKLYLLLTVSFFVSYLWFIFISTSGWTRHVWHTLLIAMLLISSVIGKLFYLKKDEFKLLFSIFLFLFLTSLNFQKMIPNFFINDSILIKWNQERYSDSIQGLPHTPVFSLKDQKALEQYFNKFITPEDKIYYLGWFLVPEASTITNKVFFTLDRYLYYDQKYPHSERSLLIFGPYQKGELSMVGKEYHDNKVKNLCKQLLYANNSYTICKLKDNLKYVNHAYQ